ncbi:PTS galactosamine transporter subunit IIC [Lacrimispora sp.]|jgi:PTS system galactosamine-specific IIC component|uniref:PTS galactosamine transporter subunit IIC n=1 Tax=Lacrimispora sp. TaxID=2719234 RepID=UPI0028AC8327|nr:PTS galactosamine transporter subunit IIC [Lacrimispora sp.]
MAITFGQGISLALMTAIVGIDFWLESFFIFRPIIVCTLAGFILGDLQLGLMAGGITELAFAGLTPAGGTQPPNPILAGVMTVVLAYTTRVEATAAMALSLPFSFLMQYVILFCYSSFSLFMKGADRAAEEADTDKIVRINIICTCIITFLYALVVFLSAYIAQDAMKALVTAMPAWLTHGFEVSGGILPAVGFAMLLKVMLKREFMPYLLIGFVISCFLTYSNLLPVAIVGVAFALMTYNTEKGKALMKTVSVVEEDDEDGI